MKCEYCDSEIDSNALSCPHCGGSTNNKTSEKVDVEETNESETNINESVMEVAKMTTEVNNYLLPEGNLNNNKKKKNQKNMLIGGSIIGVLAIAIILIVVLLNRNSGVNVNIVYSSDYEDSPYYIEEDTVTIDNTDDYTTTRAKTTVATTRTTKINYTSIPVDTVITTRKTTSTSTTKRTTSPIVITTTKPQNTTRPTVAPQPSSTTTSTTATISPVVPTTTVAPTSPIIDLPDNETTTSTTTTTTTTTTSTTTTTTTQTPEKPQNNINERTVMIYMVGSDLESSGGSASMDILEMAEAYTDDYTNIYIYTGGANYWYLSNISSVDNGLFLVKNGYLYPKKNYGNKNVGASATLAEFINDVYDNTTSNAYDLILWDHGGGPLLGYGLDEKSDDRLFLAEIVDALAMTSFNRNNKLEFIGFDACLMGSVEIAYALSSYADFLIASEETEFAAGWDYHAFENASSLNTLELAKKIIDSFAQSNIDYMNSRTDVYSPYTLSLIDLSKVDSVVNAINTNFEKVTSTLASDYEKLAYLRLNTIEFGQSATFSYDLIDLYHFADQASLSELKSDVEKSVIYSSSNLKNAHGLSFYFPFRSGDEETTRYLLNYIYAGFEGFEKYFQFMNNFINIRYGETRRTIDLSNNKAEYKKGTRQLSLSLSKDEKTNIAKSNYIIFEKCEDGNYLPVFKGNDLRLDGDKLVADYDNRILNIIENGDVGTVPIYESKKTNKGTEYMSGVVLFDFEDEMIVDSGWAKFFIKGDDITFQGIVPDALSEDGQNVENKKSWDLEDWQSVQFTNFRYKILDEKGHYTSNWKSLDTYYLYEISPKKNKVEFKINKLDPNKEYYAVINVLDFQGNRSSTDLIPIK